MKCMKGYIMENKNPIQVADRLFGALELLDPFARQNVRSARFARMKFQSNATRDVLVDELIETQQRVTGKFRRPIDDRLFGSGGA